MSKRRSVIAKEETRAEVGLLDVEADPFQRRPQPLDHGGRIPAPPSSPRNSAPFYLYGWI